MRKWSFILFCLTALAGLIVWVGCEGDTGLTGVKGSKGRQGTIGYDPDRLPPADRVFAFAVTNATENAISGKRQIYLTFDSTVKASRDTVVASKVSVPPLIDGLDGEEYEWGAQKSKMPLAFLDADSALPGHADCKLKNGLIRVAYDDNNIYLQFQWQEQPVAEAASVGESKEPNELTFTYRKDLSIKKVKRYSCRNDSTSDTSYALVRVTYEPSCLFEGQDPCFCYDLRSRPDTSYLWVKRAGSGEDRLVVFFPDEASTGWQDVAFKQFFDFTSINPEMPSDFFVDVWAWGAARTRPVGVADDWSISTAGANADAGQAPYIDNYSDSDSLPRYMNRRDPNLRTSQPGNQTAAIYPLWYFDAVGYTRFGWAKGTDRTPYTCSLPGIITMIPSGSRADVYAAARFDNSGGFWTVEMKRARRTHNGDDVQL
ncbi:MAG: hypothetical protein E4G91_05150 [Candidatus Zixiibacteriota bacterium]|nr:MAG: hypothetical protein E4G91_05150 [candidate division Zixibacteria bacterium]